MKKLVVFLSLLFLFSCSKDPCEDIACVKGNCNDGTCVCPEGFGGNLCENEIVPSSISITALRVMSHHSLNPNGMPWDDGDFPEAFPDIAVTIGLNGQQLWESNILLINAEDDQQAHFGVVPPLVITDVNELLEVGVWDVDIPDYEPMALMSFTSYQPGFDFPRQLNFGQIGEMHVQLQVEYEW